MPKIVAWQCASTGQVFICEKEYRNHLRRLGRQRLNKKKAAQRLEDLRSKLRNLSTVEEIEAAAPQAAVDFYRAYGVVLADVPAAEHFKVRFIGLQHGNCSNSHVCPVGGVTNWSGYDTHKGAPNSYPGFKGRISVSMSEEFYKADPLRATWSSNTLTLMNFKTGSGGGGREGMGYEVTLFDADWPGLERAWHEKRMLEKLSA